MTKPGTKKIEVELPLFQIKGLERAAKVVPHETTGELVALVLSKGLIALLGEGELSVDAKGNPPLETAATLNPFPKKRMPSSHPHYHQQVENYVGVSLRESLRQRLQDALIAANESDQEKFFQRLLELGVERVEQEPADPATVFDELREIKGPLTARQRMAWQQLISLGLRGWR